ncbi:hypothetical protein ACFQU1_20485 [Chelatococcus sp. GCM10030263]|uniref:hypothetical protein n=1 Tax=Chelatococcus sp. GCM10030263 TaxID=3273387 RepID=UPI00360F8AA9
MALPSWPASVPSKPQLSSWSIDQLARPLLETDMDGGNVRARRKFVDVIAQMPYAIVMSATQYAAFKAFLLTDLGQGAAEFTMPVYTGTGCESKTVRIIGGANAVKVQPVGPMRLVSFSLDVRDI